MTFIEEYNDVMPQGFCQHIIQEFESMRSAGVGNTRQQSDNARKTIKDDFAIFLGKWLPMKPFNNQNPIDVFNEGLQRCWLDYVEKYPGIQENRVNSRIVKAQKTSPGEGYHVWHHEQGAMETGQSNRSLVWMLYLNTLDEENFGETEFLYQQKRVRPIENKLIIWPAAFTHTHRGNVVHGDKAKYILTGWFNNE